MIIQSTPKSGAIRVLALSENLKGAELHIMSHKP
jgi:hypothetical protein